MKPLTLDAAKAIAADARRSAAGFKAKTLAKIEAMIAPMISEEVLAAANVGLADAHVGKLDIATIAKIAYVHSRSIDENDGYSPVDRIQKYLAKNGISINRTAIRQSTKMLLEMEFLVLLEEENKKEKRCRKFRLGDGISF